VLRVVRGCWGRSPASRQSSTQTSSRSSRLLQRKRMRTARYEVTGRWARSRKDFEVAVWVQDRLMQRRGQSKREAEQRQRRWPESAELHALSWSDRIRADSH